MLSAYEAGLRSIGENRVQEALGKYGDLEKLAGLNLRLIGHLQSNKARKAVDLFDTIDAVDSVKLARKLSNIAHEKGIEIPVLIEVNTAGDPAKFGFDTTETGEMLEITELDGVKVEGLMTIGTLTEDEGQIRAAFRDLREVRDKINHEAGTGKQLVHLSMGMSGDFEIAVEEGATMVRLGTVLFGTRPG